MRRPRIINDIIELLEEDYVAVLGQNDSAVTETIRDLNSYESDDMKFLFIQPHARTLTDPERFFSRLYSTLVAEVSKKLGYTVPNDNEHLDVTMKIIELFENISDRYNDQTIVLIIPSLSYIASDPLRHLLLLLREMGEDFYCHNIRILAYGGEKLWTLCYEGRVPSRISPFNRAERYLLPELTSEELVLDFQMDQQVADQLVKDSDGGIPAFIDALYFDEDETIDETLQSSWQKLSPAGRDWLIDFAKDDTRRILYRNIDQQAYCKVPMLDDTEATLRNVFWSGFLKMDLINSEWFITWRSKFHYQFVVHLLNHPSSPQSQVMVAEVDPMEDELRKHIMDSLNDRNIEILRYMAQGFTNREIADLMGYAYTTIKAINTREIFPILGVNSRSRAAAIFRQCDI